MELARVQLSKRRWGGSRRSASRWRWPSGSRAQSSPQFWAQQLINVQWLAASRSYSNPGPFPWPMWWSCSWSHLLVWKKSWSRVKRGGSASNSSSAVSMDDLLQYLKKRNGLKKYYTQSIVINYTVPSSEVKQAKHWHLYMNKTSP